MSFFTLTGLHISKKGHLMLLCSYFLEHGMYFKISFPIFSFYKCFLDLSTTHICREMGTGAGNDKSWIQTRIAYKSSPKISECEQTANPQA